ncbi:hypothetical protein EOE67_11605 [Rheinheimera riviphila]|uniref:Uncharacterized protein n=1 Tax=Rheinheimera riviphila TaxID=1834037 RepID=A0A437QRU1_9GAMM|nr:hypothetical protein [Rheinheimera riviphila]RVU37231.1 hypothetical protein EOE67_11605 [Rheinheimera riviphila]
MANYPSHRWRLILPLLLSACSAVQPTTDTSGICIGNVLPAPAGLIAASDPLLLQNALGAPGTGKLCLGQVLIVTEHILVYRVWDQTRPESLYGSWWSFNKPGNNLEQYRIDNAICPEWSALDVVSVCQVKIGSKLVTGPGQSATCSDKLTYPPSPVNQIYLPNNLQQNLLQVENCSAGAPWPKH